MFLGERKCLHNRVQHLGGVPCDAFKYTAAGLSGPWLLHVQQFLSHMQIRQVGFMTGQSLSFRARSEGLMSTTTIDLCLVHQAQSNPGAVAESEMGPVRTDLLSSDNPICSLK
jgi:hypothetical protein